MALLSVPRARLRLLRDEPPRADADYVLYWMTGARRARSNFALDRAVEWADELGKPLVVLEALRSDYRWACDRFHQFVIDGMRANAAAFADSRIGYYPYLEPYPGASRGMLAALSERAAVVVADDTPVFDLTALLSRAAQRVQGRLEAVDGYGIVPLTAPGITFPTAYAFRRYLQRTLPEFLRISPRTGPPEGRDRRPVSAMPTGVLDRWPPARLDGEVPLASFPIDHSIGSVPHRGGATEGLLRLEAFVAGGLRRYDQRSHPDAHATSGLSPYLHFGHVSPHDVVWRVLGTDGWSFERLSRAASGRREGWWGASPQTEGFLDQVITWRELGGNGARADDYATYESLPAWARETLGRHAGDPRRYVYSLDAFASASTHDEVWNAAQRELALEGTLHNYMRMLWGKKILEWTASPREALDVMVELNNRYALDGRDPNSYSGIFWVMGRYDRPWGPERPIYGTIRYMTSENAVRKLDLEAYLRRHGPARLF